MIQTLTNTERFANPKFELGLNPKAAHERIWLFDLNLAPALGAFLFFAASLDVLLAPDFAQVISAVLPYGERSGNARPRTSLIVAQCGNQLWAPVLFQGATNAIWFNY